MSETGLISDSLAEDSALTALDDIHISFYDSVEAIGRQDWLLMFRDDNPFTQFDYLLALEQSQCVCPLTGWTPKHIVVQTGDKVVAILPCYEKTHSWGEYVFDWAWAEAYERNGLQYYPKLVAAIPFTPVTGQRFGIMEGASKSVRHHLISCILNFLNRSIEQDFSSWHCLFLPKDDFNFASQQSIARLATQFHWGNRGYQNFDDYLRHLVSRKRKTIVKERRMVSEYHFEFITGEQASSAQWEHFIECYQQTYLKRSGHTGYLSSDFFEQLADTMGNQIRLLIISDPQQTMVASALYFVSKTHLYGRYWGCLQEVDGLHFEACYYQGIEYAIKHGLTTFDAGAQGEHKVARGFEPIETYSNHNVAHAEFSHAINHYCQQEQLHIKQYMTQMSAKLPYKQNSE
ncbi:hypothetical protein AN944_00853 [Shewanella sp. P1-14-1]|uniref:GNAT family N-acetyltransferase n=1 Tax=Shewanella TaxID=22 RepID=UPI0006E637DE|nr:MULTISPECIES: GNAT family N-acetyltransferase [Shewanella]KPZ72611.1 hypothetical protein AN944_00853 [Shewanella sp. P1-14-1]